MGYIAWSWTGNSADAAVLDMAEGPEGPLTTWGLNVMQNHEFSIQNTAQKASIFQ
jgi:mannan endo-1,4-beta-mannosidase